MKPLDRSTIQKMSVLDVQVLKLAAFIAGLIAAKVWPPILSLELYWYVIIFILSLAYLFYVIFLKKHKTDC